MKAPERLHFIGIGGIGMSALAHVALGLGSQVSGSDRSDSPLVQKLVRQGARVRIGHDPEAIPPGDVLVVVSTAIKADNPELRAARDLGLTVWHRSQLLAHFMGQCRSLAVTGTHGKTTTSAMAACVLHEAGLSPTSFIGGEVPQLGSNASLGDGSYLVAEVDESDRSLRALTAETAIVTNLEADHLDHYKDLDEIIACVATFLRAVTGPLILCGDDAGAMRLPALLDREVVTYGFGPGCQVQGELLGLQADGSVFLVTDQGEPLGEFTLRVPGRHNVANALAVIAVARRIGVGLDAIRRALAHFRPVARRFQRVGDVAGMSIVDDYAHHPSEIRAVLAAARLSGQRITAIFQPHRYSRLTAFLHEFGASLTEADRVVITDIYAAGESPDQFPVRASDLADSVRRQAPDLDVVYLPTFEAIIDHVLNHARAGEMVLTLGAGDITKLAHRLVAAPVGTAG